jgi:hypothetical protein
MHFRRAATALLLTLAALVCTGCLDSDILIKVRRDGSGTIEQSVLVNPKTFENLAALASQTGRGDATPPSAVPLPKDLLDESKLKEAAARMGPGVRFVSVAPVTQGAMEGARAVFAFDDVNTLNVTQSPQAGSTAPSLPVTFRLDRSTTGPAVLNITTVEQPRSASAPTSAPPAGATRRMPPEMLALVKPFLQDLRIVLAVDVEGSIVRTNAEHVTGSRVTLLELDFGPLLDDPAAFEKLATLGHGASLDDVKPLVKDLPGVRMNTSPAIAIAFQ